MNLLLKRFDFKNIHTKLADKHEWIVHMEFFGKCINVYSV